MPERTETVQRGQDVKELGLERVLVAPDIHRPNVRRPLGHHRQQAAGRRWEAPSVQVRRLRPIEADLHAAEEGARRGNAQCLTAVVDIPKVSGIQLRRPVSQRGSKRTQWPLEGSVAVAYILEDEIKDLSRESKKGHDRGFDGASAS